MRESLRATMVGCATAGIALAAPSAAARADDDLFETPGLYEPDTPYGRSPTARDERNGLTERERDDPLATGPLDGGSEDPYAPDPAYDDAGPIDDEPTDGGGRTANGGLY